MSIVRAAEEEIQLFERLSKSTSTQLVDVLKKVEKLIDASEALKADLLERADTAEDGSKIVNVSCGRWLAFKQALDQVKGTAGVSY